jgi:hypothetical protein
MLQELSDLDLEAVTGGKNLTPAQEACLENCAVTAGTCVAACNGNQQCEESCGISAGICAGGCAASKGMGKRRRKRG